MTENQPRPISFKLEAVQHPGSARNLTVHVALSTAEAEYVALSSATQESVWLRRL